MRRHNSGVGAAGTSASTRGVSQSDSPFGEILIVNLATASSPCSTPLGSRLSSMSMATQSMRFVLRSKRHFALISNWQGTPWTLPDSEPESSILATPGVTSLSTPSTWLRRTSSSCRIIASTLSAGRHFWPTAVGFGGKSDSNKSVLAEISIRSSSSLVSMPRGEKSVDLPASTSTAISRRAVASDCLSPLSPTLMTARASS